ncbi:hypothetical protein [Actinoplanes regularis]|uniref:hypothetical protein n=1 Tax=Actinoplanes regularis TaxID=52697 RepID=UPI001177AD32|nr:hypothetical protein [Actinoplanes regularis]
MPPRTLPTQESREIDGGGVPRTDPWSHVLDGHEGGLPESPFWRHLVPREPSPIRARKPDHHPEDHRFLIGGGCRTRREAVAGHVQDVTAATFSVVTELILVLKVPAEVEFPADCGKFEQETAIAKFALAVLHAVPGGDR